VIEQAACFTLERHVASFPAFITDPSCSKSPPHRTCPRPRNTKNSSRRRARFSQQVVRDVHEFPGHIACDSASQSEVVVPLVAPDGTLIGVWDVDSPVLARFDEEDAKGMEALCAVFIEAALPRAS